MNAQNNVENQDPNAVVVANALINKGRASASRNWKADEGLALIIGAKHLCIDDTTSSGDPRWETLGSNVANELKVTARTTGSNSDHLKTMIKVVRSVSSAYSMAAVHDPNLVKCPELLSPSADEALTLAFNRGSVIL